MITYFILILRYSQIVFYDHDGTLAANILSSLKHTFDLLISDRVMIVYVETQFYSK